MTTENDDLYIKQAKEKFKTASKPDIFFGLVKFLKILEPAQIGKKDVGAMIKARLLKPESDPGGAKFLYTASNVMRAFTAKLGRQDYQNRYDHARWADLQLSELAKYEEQLFCTEVGQAMINVMYAYLPKIEA